MPAGIASMVFLLAEKTGWSVDYILWDVPLALLLQSNFVSLWSKNIKARRVNPRVEDHDRKELAKVLGLES